MSNSDIFNRFAKIAQDKGIISKEDLYGLKPETPKDMQYKNNIMENAHKGSLFISPAYDKLNGLVENNIERQNIILNIVNKNNDGLLTQRKYAKKDLVLALVRVANDLDNQDKEKLRVLADSCLNNLTKQGAGPLLGIGLLGWTGIVATVSGLIWAQQHLKDIDRGFKLNHDSLIEKINEIITKDIDFSFGYKINDLGKAVLEELVGNLNELKSVYDKHEHLIIESIKPRTLREVIEDYEENKATYQKLAEAYLEFQQGIENIEPAIKQLITSFQNKSMRRLYVDKVGGGTEIISDLIGEDSYIPLLSSDFEKAANSAAPYLKSLQDLMDTIKQSQVIIKNSISKAENYKKETGVKPSELETSKPTISTPDLSDKSTKETGMPLTPSSVLPSYFDMFSDKPSDVKFTGSVSDTLPSYSYMEPKEDSDRSTLPSFDFGLDTNLKEMSPMSR